MFTFFAGISLRIEIENSKDMVPDLLGYWYLLWLIRIPIFLVRLFGQFQWLKRNYRPGFCEKKPNTLGFND
jgi:hypothetical protein